MDAVSSNPGLRLTTSSDDLTLAACRTPNDLRKLTAEAHNPKITGGDRHDAVPQRAEPFPQRHRDLHAFGQTGARPGVKIEHHPVREPKCVRRLEHCGGLGSDWWRDPPLRDMQFEGGDLPEPDQRGLGVEHRVELRPGAVETRLRREVLFQRSPTADPQWAEAIITAHPLWGPDEDWKLLIDQTTTEADPPAPLG